MGEYRQILGEMVNIFIRLVELLVKVGLLTTNINFEDIDLISGHTTLTGEPTSVFDNGNIWIDVKYNGGNLRSSE
jgi:hypothetical protein